MNHTYSIETLYHFNCGVCSKWWSIGDFKMPEDKIIICPHCGDKNKLKQK